MKQLISVTTSIVMFLALGTAPAAAGTILYDNGAYNGEITARTINLDFGVSDSFNLSSGATVTGATFVLWAYPGDTLTSVGWAISSDPAYLGNGMVYGSGTATAAESALGDASYGYTLLSETISIPDLALEAGTFWLTLQYASVPNGDPIYWDTNNGPSVAWQTSVGNLQGQDCEGCSDSGSQTFQILGDSFTSAVPEPSSFAMLGLGLVGMAGLIRRRLSR